MISLAAFAMVMWIEGESFNYASEMVKPTRVDYAAASGGQAMYGPGVDSRGSVIRWDFEVDHNIPDAQIIFRYCRLHWRESMKPAPFELVLTSGDFSKTLQAHFDNTGGWGSAAKNWGIYKLGIGDIPSGKYTMQITSLADNNSINLDGFFIAAPDFNVSARELSSMVRLDIDSQGYIGLVLDSTTISQNDDTFLPVATRSFNRSMPQVKASIESELKVGMGAMLPLTGKAGRRDPEYDRILTKFALGHQNDGPRKLILSTESPKRKVEADLLLVGKFMSKLDERVDAIDKFAGDYSKVIAANRSAASAKADFTEAAIFLKHGRDLLNGSIAEPENAWKAHLATNEGVANAAPLAQNLRKVLEQYEQTIEAIKADKDPYEGRSGEMRRAWYSSTSGELLTYRCLIPDAYQSEEKVPLILMLHGGGGNENTFHDMKDGKILSILNERGYFMLAPKYHTRRQPSFLSDLAELVDMTLRAYPKIDRNRIYCTGVSMGGFSTVSMANAYPDMFAAIAPVSGTGRIEMADNLSTTPTIIFQGGSDTVVPPAGAKKMAARLTELGYENELHLFEPNGHDYKIDPYLMMSLEYFSRFTKPASK